MANNDNQNMSNDDIFKKLKVLGVSCGPVTDSTREFYLKKLRAHEAVLTNAYKEGMTDSQLRSALELHGFKAGPITSSHMRSLYLNKLSELKKRRPIVTGEPMDVEFDFNAQGRDDG